MKNLHAYQPSLKSLLGPKKRPSFSTFLRGKIVKSAEEATKAKDKKSAEDLFSPMRKTFNGRKKESLIRREIVFDDLACLTLIRYDTKLLLFPTY